MINSRLIGTPLLLDSIGSNVQHGQGPEEALHECIGISNAVLSAGYAKCGHGPTNY